QSEYLDADIAVDCRTRSLSVTSGVHTGSSAAANVRMIMVRVRLRDIGASFLEGESSGRAASRMDKRSSVAFLASRFSAISLAERAARKLHCAAQGAAGDEASIRAVHGRLLAGRNGG